MTDRLSEIRKRVDDLYEHISELRADHDAEIGYTIWVRVLRRLDDAEAKCARYEEALRELKAASHSALWQIRDGDKGMFWSAEEHRQNAIKQLEWLEAALAALTGEEK